MKEPRNEREALRLIQDSGFARIDKGKLVEWSIPHRQHEECDDESGVWLAGGVVLLLAPLVAIVAIVAIVAFG